MLKKTVLTILVILLSILLTLTALLALSIYFILPSKLYQPVQIISPELEEEDAEQIDRKLTDAADEGKAVFLLNEDQTAYLLKQFLKKQLNYRLSEIQISFPRDQYAEMIVQTEIGQLSDFLPPQFLSVVSNRIKGPVPVFISAEIKTEKNQTNIIIKNIQTGSLNFPGTVIYMIENQINKNPVIKNINIQSNHLFFIYEE